MYPFIPITYEKHYFRFTLYLNTTDQIVQKYIVYELYHKK